MKKFLANDSEIVGDTLRFGVQHDSVEYLKLFLHDMASINLCTPLRVQYEKRCLGPISTRYGKVG